MSMPTNGILFLGTLAISKNTKKNEKAEFTV